MSVVERQVHGYRHGHQLLAASTQLQKEDQSVIDRLSDLSGPLRPSERFKPYLTAYPLPSREWFVFARTWQDLTVARAGCVRTLSLIIRMSDWAEAEGLSAYLNFLRVEGLPQDNDATQVVVQSALVEPLPPVLEFVGSELLEALFLEEAKPVVVLDAIEPDLIATRILTALWPSLRRRFSLSTFALSPRKVAGRDFDLLFAPKNARAKFADWNGRRVDGRSLQRGRHPWTETLVSRVFNQATPQLLSTAELELVDVDDPGIDNAALLRIAMLWEELVDKLRTSPTAALGLLDIANSGKVRDKLAYQTIEPSLANAAKEASETFSEAEAWSFLGALARKLLGRSMPMGRAAVGSAIEQLAARAPEGAVTLLSQDDPRGVVADLLPKIASGFGSSFTDRTKNALLNADPAVLGRLLAQNGPLLERVADDRPLVAHLGKILPQLDAAMIDEIGFGLLPLLKEDWQLPVAKPLIERLDGPQLSKELCRLGRLNDFSATEFSSLVMDRALYTAPRTEVRSALLVLPPTPRRNALIARTLTPCVEDARWLVNSDLLDQGTAATMLLNLLRHADDRQFTAMIVDKAAGPRVINTLTASSDLLLRAVSGDALPIATFLQLLPPVINEQVGEEKATLARHALSRCIGLRFGGDDVGFLVSMLNMLGGGLDGTWAARIGLAKRLDAATVSRNMVTFQNADKPARHRIVSAIADVAQILLDRPNFDLDEIAVESCAALMRDAEHVNPGALLNAAALLLPNLLRLRSCPVSPMIVATFPPIHRELAKARDVPDLFKFIPFVDWDRCKAARHELVDAFMSSSWPPGDLALTACRTNEVVRIMRRVLKQHGGEAYIRRVALDVDTLPDWCREKIGNEILRLLDDF